MESRHYATQESSERKGKREWRAKREALGGAHCGGAEEDVGYDATRDRWKEERVDR